MLMMLALNLNHCFGPFAMLPVEGSSQTTLFRDLSNPLFGVLNFGNSEAMRVTLFRKCWKFDVDLKNAHKNSEKVFCFCDKCISIVPIESFLLRREYLSSIVNDFTKSLKNLHLTKSVFFKLSYFQSDQWIWERCWRWKWSSFSARLPCCLSRRHRNWDFSDIYLRTCFGLGNFRNT